MIETTHQINQEQMNKIRREVVLFHLDYNQMFTLILNVICSVGALLFLLDIVAFHTYIFPLVVEILFIVFFICVIVLSFRRIQMKLAVKGIDKAFNKYHIDYVKVAFKADENELKAITTIADKVIEGHHKYEDMRAAKYVVNEDLIIFTKGRLASNYGKGRPRYVYLGSLESDDKALLVNYIKTKSKRFITEDHDIQIDSKKRSKKNHSTLLLVVIIMLLLSAGGGRLIFAREPFDPEALVEPYDIYVKELKEDTFEIFGYLEGSHRITLTTYFINSDNDTIISSLETTFGTMITHDVISDDIEVCKHNKLVYGFGSHLETNLIIRTTKSHDITLSSTSLEFTKIDSFMAYDYYIASYYGSVQDLDLISYTINGELYHLD